jgi:hypothetical protein
MFPLDFPSEGIAGIVSLENNPVKKMNFLKWFSVLKAKFCFLLIVEEFMKKLATLTKVFGFALLIGLCQGTFAQELSFDGVIAAGLGWYFADDDVTFKTVDIPYEAVAGIFRLNAALDNTEKTAGVKFRLEAQPGSFNGLYPIARYFYGYANLFGNILTIKGGMVDDGTFESAGNIVGDDAGEGLGGLVMLSPLSMLKLGFGAYIGPRNSDTIRNVKAVADGSLDPGDARYTANAAFALPDIFDVTLAYGFKYRDMNPTIEDPPEDPAKRGDILNAGVNITAIESITLAVEVSISGIADNEIGAQYGLTTAWESNVLTLGLDGLLQTDHAQDNPAVFANLYGSYAIQQVTPRFDVYFGLGGLGESASYVMGYYYGSPTYNTGDMLIGFRPSVTYSATDKASIEAGDLINIKIPNGGDTKLDNAVYISLVYKF